MDKNLDVFSSAGNFQYCYNHNHINQHFDQWSGGIIFGGVNCAKKEPQVVGGEEREG